MPSFRYVLLDPTGNLTCLVLDPVPAALRPRVTAALMGRCEQVGYLERPFDPAARARLSMMGGEFCGYASMAAAAWLAQMDGAAGETVVPLEVSGAEGVVFCAVRPLPDGAFEGTVSMPPVREILSSRLGPFFAPLVRLDGIAHWILPDHPLLKAEAEALLTDHAPALPDPSAGLLLWDSQARFMRPLVWVRGSGTLVWETGCGSGSTAVGAWLSLPLGDGTHTQDIRQPGGVIRVSCRVQSARPAAVSITGRVRLGPRETLTLP